MKHYNENLATINNRYTTSKRKYCNTLQIIRRSHYLSSALEQKRKFCLYMRQKTAKYISSDSYIREEMVLRTVIGSLRVKLSQKGSNLFKDGLRENGFSITRGQ
jgi:hypothetical protein